MEQILKEKLVGAQLGSVEFVMDYLQLHFDGPTITVFYFPELVFGEETVYFSNDQYRNRLCSIISSLVEDVEYEDDDLLVVRFQRNQSIKVDINPERNKTRPEIAMFHDDDRIWAVW